MKITSSNLIRFSGLALVPAGIVFAGIQPIHPPDVVESVTTTRVGHHHLPEVRDVHALPGRHHGLYARQVEKAGVVRTRWRSSCWQLSWTLLTGFVFTEAFILPPLAATAPAFVDAVLGISYGHTGDVNLGALPTLYSRGVGITYMLGGLLFGIATFRAGILPRVPAGFAGHRRHADSAGGTAPARATAVRRDSGGVCSGLAGLCALLRATSVSRSGGACHSERTAQSGGGQVSRRATHRGAGERSCRTYSQISGTCRFRQRRVARTARPAPAGHAARDRGRLSPRAAFGNFGRDARQCTLLLPCRCPSSCTS